MTGISIDKTPPIIEFSGEDSYGLLDEVEVLCVTSDALSGVAQTTCTDVRGPAHAFFAENTVDATTIQQVLNLLLQSFPRLRICVR